MRAVISLRSLSLPRTEDVCVSPSFPLCVAVCLSVCLFLQVCSPPPLVVCPSSIREDVFVARMKPFIARVLAVLERSLSHSPFLPLCCPALLLYLFVSCCCCCCCCELRSNALSFGSSVLCSSDIFPGPVPALVSLLKKKAGCQHNRDAGIRDCFFLMFIGGGGAAALGCHLVCL